MTEKQEPRTSGPDDSDSSQSDASLLEDALQDALAAHAAGLLAAPFGVDCLALARARRRAEEADAQRQRVADGPHPDSA